MFYGRKKQLLRKEKTWQTSWKPEKTPCANSAGINLALSDKNIYHWIIFFIEIRELIIILS